MTAERSARWHDRPLDLQPRTAHEALTRQMVEELSEDVAEIRADQKRIFYAVIGAGVLQVVMRALGL